MALRAQEVIDLKAAQDLSAKAVHIHLLKTTPEVSFEQILQSDFQAQFATGTQDVPNFGYNNQVAYWLRIRLRNPHADIQDWLLRIEYTLLDSLRLYQQDSLGQWQVLKTGYRMPYHTRGIPHTGFAFPLRFDRPDKELYLRVWGHSPVSVPIDIVREASFVESARLSDVGYGTFFGAILVMMLYNLFVFYAVRDVTYLYYVGSICCTLIIVVSVSGYGFKYLWTDTHEVNFYINRISMSFIVVMSGIFSIKFLHTRKYAPWMHRVVWFWMSVGMISTVLACFSAMHATTWYPKMPNTASSVAAILLLVTGITCWRKGNKVARFYVAAWTFYLLGGILLTLRNAGKLPFSFWTNHSFEIGALLEVVLLSLALGDRYRLLRQEREAAVSQNLRLQQEANEALEAKVTARTQQLMEVNEELHQIVEELNTANDTLNDLNEALGVQKRELEKKNDNITSSINYARRIQEAILPTDARMAEVFGEDRFFALYRPRDVVSGDFYWISHQEGETLLAVADCTGHGVPGAFMSIIGHELLNHTVNDRHIRQPEHILHEVHEGLLRVLRQKGQHDIQDGMDMAIVRICPIDEGLIRLTFAGAMHPMIVIEGHHFTEIKGSKRPIGGRDFGKKRGDFQSESITVGTGAMLYLFSDGYKDQFGGREGRKFMNRRFKELLRSIHSQSLAVQCQHLEQTLDTWIEEGREQQTDDITVMGIRL